MDPVTLYDADGRSVVVSHPREVTNLRMSGYRDTPPQAIAVETPAGEPNDTFDPSAHTVEEVQAFLVEHPELTEVVLAAEMAGKNRSTLAGSPPPPTG